MRLATPRSSNRLRHSKRKLTDHSILCCATYLQGNGIVRNDGVLFLSKQATGPQWGSHSSLRAGSICLITNCSIYQLTCVRLLLSLSRPNRTNHRNHGHSHTGHPSHNRSHNDHPSHGHTYRPSRHHNNRSDWPADCGSWGRAAC